VFESVKSRCCVHMVNPNSNRPEQNEVGNERANSALNSARDWLARCVQSADDFAVGIRRARDVHISAHPVRLCEHHFTAANESHSAWSTSTASPLASLQPENTLYQLGGCAVDLLLTMTRILLTIAIVLQSLKISAWALVGGTAIGHFTSRVPRRRAAAALLEQQRALRRCGLHLDEVCLKGLTPHSNRNL